MGSCWALLGQLLLATPGELLCWKSPGGFSRQQSKYESAVSPGSKADQRIPGLYGQEHRGWKGMIIPLYIWQVTLSILYPWIILFEKTLKRSSLGAVRGGLVSIRCEVRPNRLCSVVFWKTPKTETTTSVGCLCWTVLVLKKFLFTSSLNISFQFRPIASCLPTVYNYEEPVSTFLKASSQLLLGLSKAFPFQAGQRVIVLFSEFISVFFFFFSFHLTDLYLQST